MKIGILGGAFDPPHVGHLSIGNAAMEALGLDEILVVPTGRNPLKSHRTKTGQKIRLKMANEAFCDEPKYAVSDIEVSRPGPSYASETLSELEMAMPADYWFIIGSDLLEEIPKWHQPERLLKKCRLAVAIRPPETVLPHLESLPEWLQEKIDIFPIEHPKNISSTAIRDMVQQGLDIARYVNPKVLDTIKSGRLYKD